MEYRYLFVGIYAAWAVVFGRGGGCCLAESPYGWGVALAGKITFLPARLGIVFPLAQRGPKPLFLLHRKRKSGSGLRKRKGGPVEIITGYGTTERWRYAVMVSLG